MARVKIDLPTKYLFSTEIKVRIGDVNYGGHVGNDAILSIVHDARLGFLNHFGYNELDVDGVSLIMADSAIIYKGESFYGDVLAIDVGVTDITKLGFDLVYKLTNKKTEQDIAHVKTGMICFDYNARKVQALPEAVKAKFSIHE